LILDLAAGCGQGLRSDPDRLPWAMTLLLAPRLIEATSPALEPVSVHTISGRSRMRRRFRLAPNPVLTEMFLSNGVYQ